MMLASLFPAIRLTHGQHVDLEWPAFAERFLSHHEIRRQKDGRLFSFAVYHGTPERGDLNVRAMTGVVIDFDNSEGRGNDAQCAAAPTLPEHHVDNLGDLTYCWYSTHSNTIAWPKWRLVLPFDREVLPHEWPAVFDGAMAMLGRDENIDTTCGELSRAYYTPSCAPGAEASAFAGFREGRLCTVEELLSMTSVVIGENVHSLPGAHARNQGRNDRLKSVAAAMLGRAEPVEAIVLELLKVDAEHNPPLFTDRTEGFKGTPEAGALKFLGSIALSQSARSVQAHDQPDVIALRDVGQAHAPQSAGSEPLRPRPASAWKDAPEPPPREWLWPEWIPMVQTTALYGDGGIGKTLAAQQLMTAVAAGLKVWHEDVRPGIALGIFCEDDEDELQRRQFAICESFGVRPAALGNLHLLSRAGDDNLLMTFKDDVGHLTPFWHQVREMVGDIRPALLTVDTAADTFGGNENIRPQVRQFVQGALTKLAIEFRCAVLLCAHPSVAGLTSGSGTGGSTAWNNSVRSRLYLSRDEVTQRLVLERKKSNYAKAGERIELMWQAGAFIRFATVPGQAMRTEADVEYEQLFLGLLREFTARGQGVGVDKRGNYAPREFGRAMREQGQSVNEMGLGMAMNRLLEMGVIELKIDERLNAKRLAVVR